MCIEPFLVNRCTSKPNPGLKDDACFLRIDCHRSESTRNRNQPVKGMSKLRRLAGEMISQPVAPTGVVEIPGNESMTTFRASPLSLFLHHNSLIIVPAPGHENVQHPRFVARAYCRRIFSIAFPFASSSISLSK